MAALREHVCKALSLKMIDDADGNDKTHVTSLQSADATPNRWGGPGFPFIGRVRAAPSRAPRQKVASDVAIEASSPEYGASCGLSPVLWRGFFIGGGHGPQARLSS